MDGEIEKLIQFASRKQYGSFKEKFAGLYEDDKAKLSKALQNFAKLEKNDKFIVKSLTGEKFYQEFLNRILNTNYSEKSVMLTNSLIFI